MKTNVTAENDAINIRFPYPTAKIFNTLPNSKHIKPPIHILLQHGFGFLSKSPIYSLWAFSRDIFIIISDNALKKEPQIANIIAIIVYFITIYWSWIMSDPIKLSEELIVLFIVSFNNKLFIIKIDEFIFL